MDKVKPETRMLRVIQVVRQTFAGSQPGGRGIAGAEVPHVARKETRFT
jgi:hypothetical protein